MPGSGHTYELVNGGAGNRNKTSGDAIFHCHFYPHFAQGMWYHIRIKDTFERGTVLAASGSVDPQNPPAFDPYNPGVGIHGSTWGLKSGKPAQGARALPDGELPDGSPIPAIVPLPGKPMAPMPAKVSVAAVDRGDFGVLSGRRGPNGLGQGPDSSQAIIDLASMAGPDEILFTVDDVTPGFPFHLAGNSCGFDRNGDGDPIGNATGGAAGAGLNCPEGTVGQRMPTPVLDLLTEQGAAAPGMPEEWAKLGGGWDGGLPRRRTVARHAEPPRLPQDHQVGGTGLLPRDGHGSREGRHGLPCGPLQTVTSEPHGQHGYERGQLPRERLRAGSGRSVSGSLCRRPG
jgi:hypothetical protein